MQPENYDKYYRSKDLIELIEEELEKTWSSINNGDNSNKLLFNGSLYQLEPNDYSELDAFHPTDVVLITKDDEWFCGLRANHFVVEIGWSEVRIGHHILISVNHKGIRCMTYISLDAFKNKDFYKSKINECYVDIFDLSHDEFKNKINEIVDEYYIINDLHYE